MTKKILIDAVFLNETRVVKVDSNNNIEDIEYETANKNQIKGNLYLAKVIRVEASLQAAFIEYGNGKSGFLPFSEINPDYYNIPAADKDDGIQTISLPTVEAPELKDDDLKESEIPESDKAFEVEVDEFDSDFETKSTNASEPPLYKRYKIQEVIKRGQVLLVQAQKEERGNKGASFTSYISLAGKYCVLMPNKPKNNGISRRISSVDERKRLKNIIDKITTASSENLGYSIILRTASTGRSSYELKKDYDYLVRLWNKIRDKVVKATAPAFIHAEEGIIQKTIRDFYDKEVSEILIQGKIAYETAVDFMKNILPTDVGNIREYRSKTPILTKHGLEEHLMKLYQPIAPLPSGGYIVINPTEALIAIDVNSGRSTAEKDIEETAFKTNLEAAKEIAKQARIRDLAGLIVIDFIDMYDQSNRRAVEKALRDHLTPDKARTQIGSISSFGLLEMSRQRLRASFLESNSVICSHCNGKGVIRADESNAMLILRTLENEIYRGSYSNVNIYAHLTAILYLINYKRNEIKLIEDKYSVKINLYQENSITSDSFSIEKIRATSSATHQDFEDEVHVNNNSNKFSERKTQEVSNETETEISTNQTQDPEQLSERPQNSENRFAKRKINRNKPKFTRPRDENRDAKKTDDEVQVDSTVVLQESATVQEEKIHVVTEALPVDGVISSDSSNVVEATEQDLNQKAAAPKRKHRIFKKYNPKFRKKDPASTDGAGGSSDQAEQKALVD